MGDGIIVVTGQIPVVDSAIMAAAQRVADDFVSRSYSGPHVDSAAIARALNEYWGNFYKYVYAADSYIESHINTSKVNLNDPAVKNLLDKLETSLGSLIIKVAQTHFLDLASNNNSLDMSGASFTAALNNISFDIRYNDPSVAGGYTSYTATGAVITLDLGDASSYYHNGLNYLLFHELGHALPQGKAFAEGQWAAYKTRTGYEANQPGYHRSTEEIAEQAFANTLGREMAETAGVAWLSVAEINTLDGYMSL